MTIFERRQRLLNAIHETPGLRVPELASLLGVSEGTIRNDLKAMDAAGQLTRVRSGAIPTNNHLLGRVQNFASRVRTHEKTKGCIARQAAYLVEDGDAIILDASSTVFALGDHLYNRKKLTVITNGIEVGRELARNPTNIVILVGGLLHSDGASITGSFGEQFLKDIHVKKAFVSCSGFSPEIGMTEVDIQEVQMKRRMIASAGLVIALIDSSKFGLIDLTPFARPEQIAHIYTDCDLSTAWQEQLTAQGIPFTLCAEI